MQPSNTVKTEASNLIAMQIQAFERSGGKVEKLHPRASAYCNEPKSKQMPKDLLSSDAFATHFNTVRGTVNKCVNLSLIHI